MRIVALVGDSLAKRRPETYIKAEIARMFSGFDSGGSGESPRLCPDFVCGDLDEVGFIVNIRFVDVRVRERVCRDDWGSGSRLR